ncbi:hypothetical protein [Endozoicomonas sp.]|uniref:hypothetical protein n=1 Tax=Endozoicomonas sp. TaxID=1892382 RepID=UPI003AF48AAF
MDIMSGIQSGNFGGMSESKIQTGIPRFKHYLASLSAPRKCHEVKWQCDNLRHHLVHANAALDTYQVSVAGVDEVLMGIRSKSSGTSHCGLQQNDLVELERVKCWLQQSFDSINTIENEQGEYLNYFGQECDQSEPYHCH